LSNNFSNKLKHNMAQPKKPVTKSKKVTASVTRKKSATVLDDTPLKERTYVYAVEEGVIMAGVRNSSTDMKFPFAIMKVGDSFLIPTKDPVSKTPNSLHYAAKIFARYKPGFTVTSRLQLDGARRVWRLK
jgi:hypothetical protein